MITRKDMTDMKKKNFMDQYRTTQYKVGMQQEYTISAQFRLQKDKMAKYQGSRR